jgi:glyoxylase-like metal-dependent hydrolase (beta-lactamase superfamily II)
LTAVTKFSSGTSLISLPFLDEPGIIGSYLLEGENQLAIIDPGPSSMIEHLLSAIREAGYDPEDVTHILTTHVHLDHAGAVGSLVRQMPGARVFVHSKGAPHLLDTSKVVASASRIYKERMQPYWGAIESVPAERLQIIEGGDILKVAGRRIEVHYTPGHAVHHVVFFDVHSGELFAGDVAGVRLQGVDYVRPPTPPPDLYLGHFGPSRDPVIHFGRLREHLYSWGDFVLNAMRQGKDEAEIIALLIEHTQPELQRIARDPHAIQRYEIASNYAMTAQGYMRYWKKHHPERLK